MNGWRFLETQWKRAMDMTTSEAPVECDGCGSTEHTQADCPFNAPPSREVLGVLSGQVPVTSTHSDVIVLKPAPSSQPDDGESD